MHQIALGHRYHSNVFIEDLKTAHRSNTSAGTSMPAAPNINIHLKKLRRITKGSMAHINTQSAKSADYTHNAIPRLSDGQI